jgi:hypothetical protein
MTAQALVFAAKLVVAPAFVVVVSLASRWFGPAGAGLLASLPVVGGPILGLIVLEQGVSFGARAARAAAAGTASTILFIFAYALAAGRCGVAASLLVAYGLFALATYGFSLLPMTLLTALAVPLVVWGAVLAVFPAPSCPFPRVARWRWDLPARALATVVLVLLVTNAARSLGPTYAGLLAPAPIATTVLAAFTHWQAGPAAVAILLRSLTRGLASYTLFFVVCGELLERASVTLAFGAALGVTLVVQALALKLPLGPRARRLGGSTES